MDNTNTDILKQGYCDNLNDKKVYGISINDFIELNPIYIQQVGRKERIKNV